MIFVTLVELVLAPQKHGVMEVPYFIEVSINSNPRSNPNPNPNSTPGAPELKYSSNIYLQNRYLRPHVCIERITSSNQIPPEIRPVPVGTALFSHSVILLR